jgi:hypothetical protein
MPTDHGFHRPCLNTEAQNRHPRMLVTGPLNQCGQRWEWDSTYCPWRTPGRSRMTLYQV